MRLYLSLICCCFYVGLLYARKSDITIVSYNVENFFDFSHDSLKNDYEFLPEGNRHWTYSRMHQKAEKIAKVINNIGGFSVPAIVGLCEVENDECLNLLCAKMPSYPYKYIHFESDDNRGVDVALLYDTTQYRVQSANALKVSLGGQTTRDVLYVIGVIPSLDTLHLFMCHLPSMSGGKVETDWKRAKVKSLIQLTIDSIISRSHDAGIIVMGDMNCEPADDINGLHNKMVELERKGEGTEKFKGKWSCLDQFYVSSYIDSLCEVSIFSPEWLLESDDRWLGQQPKRTYKGYKYQKEGYSDHLPIVLRMKIE